MSTADRPRFVAIVNPASGRGSALPRVLGVQRALHRRGAELEIIPTARPGHATEIAARLDASVRAVLIAGGDGTVCEVAGGLRDLHVPFVVLPLGTENLLARELGMPVDPEAAACNLLHGQPRAIDACEMNGRRFLAVAGVGFDAECVERFMRIRRGHITHGDYFWPIWRTFWAHKFPILHVDVDGQRTFEGRGFLIMGNISRYSIGWCVLPRAVPDDGLLDVLVYPCRSRWELTAQAARTFLGRHLRGAGGVIYRQGCCVGVSSPTRVPVEIDGEPGGELPALFRIVPAAIHCLVPPGSQRVADTRVAAWDADLDEKPSEHQPG